MSTDLKNLTTLVNKENKAKQTQDRGEERCSKCEVKVDSLVKLKIHVSRDHLETTSTQTECKEYDEKNVQTYKHEISSEEIIEVENEKFLKFSCFYCDKKIQSEHELVDHRGKCSETYPSRKPRQNNMCQPYLPVRFSEDSQMSLYPTFFNCEHCCWIVTSKAELMSQEKMCLMKPKILKFS